MPYVPGLFKRICDRTGFTVMSNTTAEQWNGIVVRKRSFEARHPQEFVRGKGDKQTVPMPRPRQVGEFVGPLTSEATAEAAAVSLFLTVDNSTRFLGGDTIGVILVTGDLLRVVMTGAPTKTRI